MYYSKDEHVGGGLFITHHIIIYPSTSDNMGFSMFLLDSRVLFPTLRARKGLRYYANNPHIKSWSLRYRYLILATWVICAIY